MDIQTFINNFSINDQDYFQQFAKNLVKSKSLNDEKKNRKIFVIYSFDAINQYPIEISFFKQSKPQYEMIAIFKIIQFLDRGLIKMEISFFNPTLIQNLPVTPLDAQKMLLKQAFFDIRDMYHKQTHAIDDGDRDEMPDSLTQPSFKTTQSDAFKEIIQFHQQKVQEYNNFNIGLMTRSQHMKGDQDVLFDSAILRRQAKGCFIYALNLIEFYKTDLTIQEYDTYKEIFKNAIAAMEAFCEEIDTFYNSKTNENLKALSILSIFIGSVIVVLTIINISCSSCVGTNGPLLWGSGIIFIIMCMLYYISVVTDVKLI